MAVSFGCKCEERKKPVQERQWEVWKRNHHRSHFAGRHFTPSDYSTVYCRSCRAIGRTKAAYVASLPDRK